MCLNSVSEEFLIYYRVKQNGFSNIFTITFFSNIPSAASSLPRRRRSLLVKDSDERGKQRIWWHVGDPQQASIRPPTFERWPRRYTPDRMNINIGRLRLGPHKRKHVVTCIYFDARFFRLARPFTNYVLVLGKPAKKTISGSSYTF